MITHTDHLHAGLEPRSRFQPPRHYVYRADDGNGNAAPLPSPLLTDMMGEDIPEREIRFGLSYTDSAFLLTAHVADANPVIAPEREATSPKFWEQDHIEFRLLPNPRRDLDQIQVILAASGKVLIARTGQDPVALECTANSDEAGWALEAQLPFEKLGIRAPE